METGPDSGKPGCGWAAQRVPDDHVAVGANGFVITELDLDNPDYFMASENVISFAVDNGWYDPSSGKPFNFAHAYKGSVDGIGTLQRAWRGYSLLAPHVELLLPEEALEWKGPDGEYYQYPFSVKAEKKISLEDLNTLVRDVYEGTPYDLTRGPLAGPFGTWHRTQGTSFRVDGERVREARGIQADSSQYTEICQMRNWLPNEIGGIVWWAPGPPKAALRVPFYAGMTELSKNARATPHGLQGRVRVGPHCRLGGGVRQHLRGRDVATSSKTWRLSRTSWKGRRGRSYRTSTRSRWSCMSRILRLPASS